MLLSASLILILVCLRCFFQVVVCVLETGFKNRLLVPHRRVAHGTIDLRVRNVLAVTEHRSIVARGLAFRREDSEAITDIIQIDLSMQNLLHGVQSASWISSAALR